MNPRKNKNRSSSAFTLIELMVVIAVIGLLAAIAFPKMETARAADQQGYPQTFIALPNVPAAFTSGQAVTFPTNVIPLRIKGGLGFQFTTALNNTNLTGGMVAAFYPSSDGTNFWTTPFATLTSTANGTNAVVTGTNWSELTLRGFKAMGVTITNSVASNATNLLSGTVTNSSGVVYQLGITVNEANQ